MIASAINAFAGGGSLLSFPMLVGLGLPSLQANATNGVALWPGSLSSALGFRSYWDDIKAELKLMAPFTLLGAGIGAFLLVATPSTAFDVLVPVLICLATLLLAFQKQVKALGSGKKLGASAAASLQFAVAVYGGYFGAGMGILMLAVLGVHAEGDIHRHNAIKNLLAVLINVVSSAVLLSYGLVNLPAAGAMMAGAIAGGFASAKFSQRVPTDVLRWVVVAFGSVMTVWFGLRAFGI